MTDEERRFSAQTLLFKIHTVTGWVLPIDAILDFLIDQLDKTLSEKYQFVNIEEFEYAFRNRGMDVKDWGKAINIGLIDEIMIPYLESRKELSKVEESKLHKAAQIEEKKELSDQEWEEWIEDIKKYPLDLIPNHLYEYLERKGRIALNNEQKHELMGKAINFVLNKLQDREFSEFLVMKNNGIFTGNYPAMLKTISKKMAVKNYFDEKPV